MPSSPPKAGFDGVEVYALNVVRALHPDVVVTNRRIELQLLGERVVATAEHGDLALVRVERRGAEALAEARETGGARHLLRRLP